MCEWCALTACDLRDPAPSSFGGGIRGRSSVHSQHLSRAAFANLTPPSVSVAAGSRAASSFVETRLLPARAPHVPPERRRDRLHTRAVLVWVPWALRHT